MHHIANKKTTNYKSVKPLIQSVPVLKRGQYDHSLNEREIKNKLNDYSHMTQ